ncbi:MAG: hypothetical protein A2Y95_00625 [Deltaproteobacteria bacterium RBG_13_65_10]|nr:MAG: hypothetical protein A2Y95_00625 [Deltaproteobacteria bacterium RBG_13_65_10]
MIQEVFRVAMIVIIAVGAKYVLDFIYWMNRKIIEGTTGSVIARSAKALTLNRLVMSFLKYAVFLVALGLILREFGVSLTAYLAGASIIGFAVAFGFQGLVQDLLSGLFVILESQFVVGDMVEVGGQVGRVEEIGLRATKLRNYLGELFILPNRSLQQVGVYPLGCVVATVEVPLDTARAGDILRLLHEGAMQLRARYPMAVITDPDVAEAEAGPGHPLARVHLSVWPGQNWVIEKAYVPRIVQCFSKEGISIGEGQVVVHYGGKG